MLCIEYTTPSAVPVGWISLDGRLSHMRTLYLLRRHVCIMKPCGDTWELREKSASWCWCEHYLETSQIDMWWSQPEAGGLYSMWLKPPRTSLGHGYRASVIKLRGVPVQSLKDSLEDNNHPSRSLFTLLSSGKQQKSICCRSTRQLSSFITQATTPQHYNIRRTTLFKLWAVFVSLWSCGKEKSNLVTVYYPGRQRLNIK